MKLQILNMNHIRVSKGRDVQGQKCFLVPLSHCPGTRAEQKSRDKLLCPRTKSLTQKIGKGRSKTRKGRSKTGKDVLKQEKYVLKQEKML
jgi:hypothetical protein